MPAVERPEPPYLQIAEHFRQQIRSGELEDGDLVPSTRVIARDWQVSVPTAAKALMTLRSEGYVRGVPGIGTAVCAGSTTNYPASDRLRAARAAGRIFPPGEHAVIKSAELVPAPLRIADALGLEPGTVVIRRHRVTYRGDSPISVSVSWLDGALAQAAPRLLSAERLIGGTVGYIREMTGREALRGTDQDSARAATAEDADDLGVEPGSPVAVGRNWWYDPAGEVLEYGERVSVPDRWSTHDYTIT